jgi:hypothetical protein
LVQCVYRTHNITPVQCRPFAQGHFGFHGAIKARAGACLYRGL